MVQMHILGPYAPISVEKIIKISLQVLRCANLAMHAPYASGHLNQYFWAKNGSNAHFRTICTYFSRKNYKNIAASAPMRELGHARTLRIGALKSIFLGKKWFKCTF